MPDVSSRQELELLLERELLPQAMLRIIATLHEPLAQLISTSAAQRPKPFVVGICGPQGSGKSTMTAILTQLLRARSLSIAPLSLDDLYLSRAERERLAQHVHPLLRTRGVPGTHDVALGMSILQALGREGSTALPSFDKATDDRSPQSEWTGITTPVDIVLFEGWFVGARPQDDDDLREPVNDLEREEDSQGHWRRFVNDALRADYQTLFEKVDLLVTLKASSFDVVYRWRSEQERKLRERLEREGGDSSNLMNERALHRFIAHFERLTRHVMAEAYARSDVVIELDDERVPRQIHGLGV